MLTRLPPPFQRPAGKAGFVAALLAGLGLMACALRPGSWPVEWGPVAPSPTPDPFAPYRAALQPAARGDIESAGPWPRYHITARLNAAGDALNGTMRVVVPNAGPEPVFRLYPNLANYGGAVQISAAQVNGSPVGLTALAGGTAVRLDMPPAAASPPDETTVALDFTVQLPRNPDSSYTLFGWDGPVLSLPGFFPALAVWQAGEWVLDRPPPHGDVLFNPAALYQLDLTLPAGMVVAAGGVTLNRINNPDGSRTWQIAGGPLRDMTVIAGPFESATEPAAGAVVTSYYLPGHHIAGRIALAHAAASLRLYSDTYGPYPYTELDVVEAPLNVRGMEYSGLVLIGEDLYREQPELLPFLVAHEVAHQWWYGLVGNNPYRHPWLDEGLTEYSAFDYYQGVFGPQAAAELLTGRWLIPFDTAAAGINGRVDRPAADFDPAGYELLVYAKAALFFNALREQVGSHTYHRILQTYYTGNRYRIATPQTFLATAEQVSGQNLNPLAETWLRQ